VHRNSSTGVVTVLEGRGVHQPAATLDRNPVSKSILLMGYFHPGSPLSRSPHPDELRGVVQAMRFMQQQRWVLSTGWKLLGHRDNPAHPGATVCPGDQLYAQLPQIRSLVTAAIVDVLPNPLGEFVRPIKQGDRSAINDVVGRWQEFLRLYVDATVAVDGVFGSQTDRVTRRYQTAARIAVDGLVGRQTWSAARATQSRR
jgi:peptidoglycan hydrolase-like protein with peptidoglycan-binding domain